jgi:predicted TPR repeat methyltransferase
MARIGETLRLQSRVPRALDVGCGTGLSTLPLTCLAHTAIGMDPARHMVAAAESEFGVHYLV